MSPVNQVVATERNMSDLPDDIRSLNVTLARISSGTKLLPDHIATAARCFSEGQDLPRECIVAMFRAISQRDQDILRLKKAVEDNREALNIPKLQALADGYRQEAEDAKGCFELADKQLQRWKELFMKRGGWAAAINAFVTTARGSDLRIVRFKEGWGVLGKYAGGSAGKTFVSPADALADWVINKSAV